MGTVIGKAMYDDSTDVSKMAQSDGLLQRKRPPPVALRSIACLKTNFRRRRKGSKKLVPSIQSPKQASKQPVSPIRSPMFLRSASDLRASPKLSNHTQPGTPQSARQQGNGANKGWLGRFRKSMQRKIVRWQRRNSVDDDFHDLRKLCHLSEARRTCLQEERITAKIDSDLPELPEFLFNQGVDEILDKHSQEREECEQELQKWGLSPIGGSIPEEICLERSDSKQSVGSKGSDEIEIEIHGEASLESVEMDLEEPAGVVVPVPAKCSRPAVASAIPWPVGHPAQLQTRRPGTRGA